MTTSKPKEELLTIQELADRWKIDHRTVRARLRDESQQMPPFIVLSDKGNGRRIIRFRVSDVEKFEQKAKENK